MNKAIEDLVEDIWKLFGGKDLSAHLETFQQDLGTIVAKRFARYGLEYETRLTLSMIGKPLRQLWYDLKGYKGESIQPEALFKYLYGDLIEALIIFLARETGHKVELLQEKVSLDEIPGRIDVVIDSYLLDIKSASTASYAKFANRTITKDDPFGYIGQLSGYTRTLLDLDYPLKGAGFLAVDKQLGKICLCLFTIEELLEYKPRDRIAKIRESLKQDTPPERCYQPVPLSKKKPDGPQILGIGCSYCRHKWTCWSDANNGEGLKQVNYANRPVWFTDIKNHHFRKEFDIFPVKE